MSAFATDIASHVWQTKYRHDGEQAIAESWQRVAHALAAVEPADPALWEARFLDALQDFRFLPGGRILAGAGTGRDVTLFNCFVMGAIEDSMPGIFQALEESAVTMQKGGGVGLDFSTLRPQGARAAATGNIATGPVSFMQVWDAMCATVMSAGARRGAMMATLRCDHPDIEAFITAKREPGTLRHFNLSVLVTDDFMAALRAGADWPLRFPAEAGGTVVRTVAAHTLWELITRSAYDGAEPGVLFIDRINAMNNLAYCERIIATNPCGEIPLPAYGACLLGSLNLTRFVSAPFTDEARIDLDEVERITRIAVRLLDNAIDASTYPLPQQAASARGSRRIGLGVTGLADALILLGLAYDSDEGRRSAADILRAICHTAYRTSVDLAREKGAFPRFDAEAFLAAGFAQSLPGDIRGAIGEHGLRNSHLIAIAPTGSISLLAGNVSSGIEPVFADRYVRHVRDEAGVLQPFEVSDPAVALWRQQARGNGDGPPALQFAADIAPEAHLDMQAALQPFVDNAISKTINVPPDCPYADFRRLFELAYEKGLKGCTAYRPNELRRPVLHKAENV